MEKIKILSIGDIHGLRNWKKIPKLHEYHHIVFHGDYFDTFDRSITTNLQIENLRDIIAFKRTYPDKVHLLLGNHDHHYIVNDQRYSGYQTFGKFDINEILTQNLSLFEIAFRFNNIVFSHAGISKTWLSNNELDSDINVEQINELYVTKPKAFNFTGYDWTGEDPQQGPLWIRIPALVKDLPTRDVQIFGHTFQKNGIYDDISHNIICVDTLELNLVLEIEIDNKNNQITRSIFF